MAERLMTAKQVADERGLTEKTVIRLRKQRKLAAVQLGYRTFLFRPSAVEAAFAKMEVKAISARKNVR